MALITCAECSREFSDKAAACPQCAAPIDVAHSDNKGPSTSPFTNAGLIERRSHNEILIRAPGPTAFEHVRDALVLIVDSIRVSTGPLSISADVEIDEPLATAKICVLFEIPDLATTSIKIEEQSGTDFSYAASQKAIERVAKTIIDHVSISLPRDPGVTIKPGVAASSVDYHERDPAIGKEPPALLMQSLIFVSVVILVGVIWLSTVDTKHSWGGQQTRVESVTKTSQSNTAVTEMHPTERYCSKATGLSKGFVEMAATRMRVSVSSVSFLSASSAGSNGCNIRIDTPRGPQSCMGGTVYSDGRDFWIGGICF